MSFGRAFGDNFAVVEDVGPVGDLQGAFDVVVGDEDADAGGNEPADFGLQLLHGNRVHAGKRLVQQNQRRIGHHRPGDFQLAAFPAGQKSRLAVDDLAEAEPFDQVVGPAFAFGLADGHGFQNRQQIFPDRQPLKDAGFLRQIAHAQSGAFVHRHFRYVVALEEDTAAVRDNHADGHAERGGLAGAVAAQEAHDRPLAHGDVHIVDHRPAGIAV